VFATRLKKSFVHGTEPKKFSISLQKCFGMTPFFQYIALTSLYFTFQSNRHCAERFQRENTLCQGFLHVSIKKTQTV